VQLLLDNLTASVIATIVILILLSMQTRATQQRAVRMSQETAQRQSRRLTDWLEKDLERIGDNLSDDEIAFRKPKETADMIKFTFDRGVIQSDGTIDTVKTRYLVEPTGESRTVYAGDQKKEVELWRFVRKTKQVGSGMGWQVDGGGISNLSYFDVDLLNGNAEAVENPVANESEVRSVRVRFSLVGPYRTRDIIPSMASSNVVVAPYPLAES
jgi:hypothetical protein